jgi:hypothetical protein
MVSALDEFGVSKQFFDTILNPMIFRVILATYIFKGGSILLPGWGLSVKNMRE